MGVVRAFVMANRAISSWAERKCPAFFGAPSCYDELMSRITTSVESGHVTKILEVGGIDRPLLKKKQGVYEYCGLDIEVRDQCYDVYDAFLVQSIEQPLTERYDLIVSMTVLEHVVDNDSSVAVMYKALNPGGETHHYIPSKWHPYSVALRIVGPTLQKRLITLLRPDSVGVTGYPAFFDKCSVPSMRRLLAKHGFTDIDIAAYYRASDYFAFCFPLFVMVVAFENVCSKLGLSLFASGFVVSAKRHQ